MVKDLFEEWSKNFFVEPLKPAIDHRLTVKFSNDKGVEKTIQVLPTKSGAGIFGAQLTEDEYYVGDFELLVLEDAPEDRLGSYTLSIVPNNEAARIHYEKNEFPIMTDVDFENFVNSFHAAIKTWKEAQTG